MGAVVDHVLLATFVADLVAVSLGHSLRVLAHHLLQRGKEGFELILKRRVKYENDPWTQPTHRRYPQDLVTTLHIVEGVLQSYLSIAKHAESQVNIGEFVQYELTCLRNHRVPHTDVQILADL